MGTAGKLFSIIADKAHEKAKESRAKQDKDREANIGVWTEVLKNPAASPEQRVAATQNLNKLYNVKGKDSPFDKVSGFLTHLGGHLQKKVDGAQRQPQQQPQQEQQPQSESGTMGVNTPKQLTSLNASPSDPNVNPAQKGLANKALSKVGKGLESAGSVVAGAAAKGLSNLGGAVPPQNLPALDPNMFPTAEQTEEQKSKSRRESKEKDIEYEEEQAAKDLGLSKGTPEYAAMAREKRGLTKPGVDTAAKPLKEPKYDTATGQIFDPNAGIAYSETDENLPPNIAKEFQSAKVQTARKEAAAQKRVQMAASSRVSAYLQGRVYDALDSDTGSLVKVTGAEVANNKGKYAPAGPAITAKNRIAIFNEIDYTSGMLNEAISKLPDTAFDATSRAQIAGVLRDEQPRAALYNFLTSDVAATLSPQQIEYVTALVSMDESAMSLRSLGGMGAGSDQLRGAIVKMLPGAGTPSRGYAQRQMVLFDGEVKALKTSIPNIGEPGRGGGQTMTPLNSPKVGTIEDGHRFMGGDPADPTSWKKVKK